MGFFWKNLKGIRNPKARGEALVETIVISFLAHKRDHPDRDCNAWLAEALRARLGWGNHNHITLTARFAVLSQEQAPVALGLHVLYSEEPTMMGLGNNMYAQIMAPVFALREAGVFADVWRTSNPWTASQFPWLLERLLADDRQVRALAPSQTSPEQVRADNR